jgi:hypothetical protein
LVLSVINVVVEESEESCDQPEVDRFTKILEVSLNFYRPGIR